VETVTVPYTDYPDSIKRYLENGWLDVVTLNGWNFREIVENDALDLFEPQTASAGSYPYLNQVFSHEGKLYVHPLIFSPVILCYNKTMLRELGISEPDSSWSWEQLLNTARRIKQERDIFGFYAHIASANRFTIALLQRNYRFACESRGHLYEDPVLWDCLGKFRDMIYSQGLFPAFLSENDADAEKLFAQRKAAMIMTTYFGLKHLKHVDFEYDLAPLPYEHQARTLLLVTGLAVSRFSRQKEAAKLFIDFMNAEESQLYIRQQTLSIPAHKASAEWTGAESLYRPSRFHLYREITPTFGKYTDLGLPIHDLSRFRDELKLFWSNLEQPESVAERLLDAAVSVAIKR
jgi:multiple sugar transport system substrate-binding protein